MEMEKRYIHESREVEVRFECDVLVAGGGTAGIVAAIAAARNGAKVIIVDRNGYLGGTMINGAGPLHSFFNLYKAFPDAQKLQVVRGIPDEIIKRLVDANACFGHLEQEIGYAYDSVATIVQWEVLKSVMFDIMEELGVKLLLHTIISDVVMEENTVTGAIVESKSGRQAILAKRIIDCTGDADVAYNAGVPCKNMYPDGHVGMPFGMANVDINKLIEYLKSNDMLNQLVHAKKEDDSDDIVRLAFDLKKVPVFKKYMDKEDMWGPMLVAHHVRDLSFINTANLKPLDALDVEEISRAEIILRKQVMTMSAMLKKYIPGFENAYLYWTPVHIGVRRTRIVECEFDISLEHIVNGVKTEDEVARYGFHDLAPKIMIKNAESYSIPYGALLPKKIDNLLVAGRLITSNWDAHMSTRNTVSCMAQGQAVGTAAALSIKEDKTPRELDMKLLRKTLIDQGVYLG